MYHSVPQEVIISQGTGTVFSAINDMYTFAQVWNTHFYKSENIQKFIKSTEHQFDVIVAEEFFIDSFLMFSYKHKAPVVTISPFGHSDFIDHQRGLISPPSHVSHWVI